MIGAVVGDFVGERVGDFVGLKVGDNVGDFDGLLVGDRVGDLLGLLVGDFVGEAHAAIADLGRRQREDLKTAAVGQDWSLPAHEAVQATQFFNESFAGPERQVVGVAEYDFCAGFANLFGRQCLDCAVRADWHEGWGFEATVWRRDDAFARRAALLLQVEAEGAAFGGRITGSRGRSHGRSLAVLSSLLCLPLHVPNTSATRSLRAAANSATPCVLGWIRIWLRFRPCSAADP